MAGVLDITIEAGASSRLALTLRDDEITPTNITGWAFYSQVRDSRDNALLAEAEVESRVDVLGQVALVFTASDTENLETIDGVYDVLAVLPSGDRERILEGTAKVTKRVTVH